MRLNPLIQAEVSVLVDVIRAPYALFLETNECRSKFLHGAFVHKYVLNSSSSMNRKFSSFSIDSSFPSHRSKSSTKTFFRLITHTTMMLIKCHEKQISFLVLNLLADYARTIQHKQTLHRRSDYEVDFSPIASTTRLKKKHSAANRTRIGFRSFSFLNRVVGTLIKPPLPLLYYWRSEATNVIVHFSSILVVVPLL